MSNMIEKVFFIDIIKVAFCVTTKKNINLCTINKKLFKNIFKSIGMSSITFVKQNIHCTHYDNFVEYNARKEVEKPFDLTMSHWRDNVIKHQIPISKIEIFTELYSKLIYSLLI